MVNAWEVVWTRDEKRVKRTFKPEDGKPTDAIIFYKSLKKEGFHPELISTRKGYAPSKQNLLERPSGRHLWCPYCIKWRIFEVRKIRKGGLLGPALDRCPICTISIHDYNVRKYNKLDERLFYST